MLEINQLLQTMQTHLEARSAKHIGNNTYEFKSENDLLSGFKSACAFVRSIADVKAIKLTDKETKVSKYFLEITF